VRHQNSLLSTATLSCLVQLFPLLVQKTASHRPHAAGSPATSTSSTTSAAFDNAMLRQLLTSFLPGGGLIDRLGDSRERARENARLGLVALGGYAFRASGGSMAASLNKSRDGKGQETPLAIFERLLREGGLASKVWRVREQVCAVPLYPQSY
jgi:CLIP-associating protein 1/2